MKSILETLEIPYTSVRGEENIIIIVTIADELVEILTDGLQKVGVGKVYGTYQIIPLEFAAGMQIKSEVDEKETAKLQRVSREEILEDIKSKARLTTNYITYSILASILAALGLLTDNIIMIIASMIIAPFIGPIIGLSLGVTLDLKELFDESLKSEATGLGISILVGFVITIITPYSHPTNQIMYRAFPTYLDLLFALTAGLAAALSIVSVEVMSIVGVAIAASLVPPAANVGVGLAFMLKGTSEGLNIVIGSFLLLTINILAINTISILLFWSVGIMPSISSRRKQVARKKIRNRVIFLVILLLIFSMPLIALTVRHFNEVSMEASITKAVKSYLQDNYPNLEIQEIEVNYDAVKKTALIHLTVAGNISYEEVSTISRNVGEYIAKKFNITTEVYISVSIVYTVKPRNFTLWSQVFLNIRYVKLT